MAKNFNKKSIVPTYDSQTFAGQIIAEKTSPNRRLRLLATAYYQHFLNQKCKVGDRVTVTVTNKRPKRTLAQNAYYWGVYLPLISQETGEEDTEALHELFKAKCLPSKIKTVLGNPVRMKKSTTELSISDFCEYVMRIEALTKVTAPPTENYDLAPLRGPLTPVRKEKIQL